MTASLAHLGAREREREGDGDCAALSLLLLLLLLLGMASELRAVEKDCLGGGFFGGVGGELPAAEEIIFGGVQRAVAGDPRMAASLLRLHFHDCFVNGCDGSVLLDDSPAFAGEKTAGPNANSLRGFEVVDVSCADILAVAARDAVALLGGPTWDAELGRRDSLTASKSAANKNIPGPNSDLRALVDRFNRLGLSRGTWWPSQERAVQLVQLPVEGLPRGGAAVVPGAGEVGFLDSLQQLCDGGNSTALAHLDLVTPVAFDNQYYTNLLNGVGLLSSDQVLVAGGDGQVLAIVEDYAADPMAFFQDFKAAMVKMGRLRAPAGAAGEVRRNCRVVN
ncbi:unnamed protein product [Spirodela intermedia]|uniref:Peroxidase n=1 Tax=Spirodela intermedia TaxID=51605 RepID=A0A7I8JE06_SPIIN|nr:unnamed protein product [Spirodela intermedia]CAA6668384.1 unnamed protein product [Spirodela intermedia]